MIVLKKIDIDKALSNPRLEEGLLRYLKLQKRFPAVDDVSGDREFQRSFNTFYKVVKLPASWYEIFYNTFQSVRYSGLTFGEILERLQVTGRVEASFGSKLLATIDPKLPIIDSVVLRNLREMGNFDMQLLRTGVMEIRAARAVEIHKQLKSLMTAYLQTDNGKYLICKFKKRFPNAKITQIKMLDLVLWQIRAKKHILKKI